VTRRDASPGRTRGFARKYERLRVEADGRAVLFVEANAIHRVVIDPATGQPIGRAVKVQDLPAQIGSQAFHIGPDGRFLMLQRVEGDDAPTEIRVGPNFFEEVRAKIK